MILADTCATSISGRTSGGNKPKITSSGLFPLRGRRGFNMTARTLDGAAIAEFLARAKLRTSFVRMLRFYGFTLKDGPPLRVVRASSCGERAEVWLSRMNHNHLRTTRILKSLKLLGAADFAGNVQILGRSGEREVKSKEVRS